MKQSAGLLLYRQKAGKLEVLIVHPGGPYFAKKDEGVWSIPKGEIDEGENATQAALREFKEEIGTDAPEGELIELGEIKYPSSSKRIQAWALEGDIDLRDFKSNTMEVEWPPRSGKHREFPEVDRAEWCGLPDASRKMFKPQTAFLERLTAALDIDFEMSVDEDKQLGLL